MRPLCLVLVLSMIGPSAVAAESHAWSRDGEGVLTSSDGVQAPDATSFLLSTQELNLCSAREGVRHRVDLTAHEGVDLIERPLEEFEVLLGRAGFAAGGQMASRHAGVELTGPDAAKVLAGPALRRADVRIGGEDVDLRLQLFQGGSNCQQAGGSGKDGLQLITAAAEADECSGACDCEICVCEGSASCCSGGCGYCWGYLDGSGACAPQ